MVGKGFQNREINQIVERQMRQWEITKDEQVRKEQAMLKGGGGR